MRAHANPYGLSRGKWWLGCACFAALWVFGVALYLVIAEGVVTIARFVWGLL